MDPVKVQAIHDWIQPTSVKSLQKFLGFAHFYRRFIANFSSVVKPLTDLTKKGADVTNWSSAAVEAFRELKRRFTSAPVLRQPYVSLPFQVEVDASEIGAGAVLSQRDSDGSLMKTCQYELILCSWKLWEADLPSTPLVRVCICIHIQGGEPCNVNESTIFSLFASGYETKPALRVPIHVVELNNVPPELRMSVGVSPQHGTAKTSALRNECQSRESTYHPSWVKTRYGAWYLDPKTWKRQKVNNPMKDPTIEDDEKGALSAERLSQMVWYNLFMLLNIDIVSSRRKISGIMEFKE
ncbi:unnamed protein product [Ranitomeya imitator]|uniref:Reverse transcriptase/retrotransposon-derived protein RNase H-like domain-containing protein n=1 Tax=Ranitomeya imitator TaxID=111125 RepID=A0ABN9MBP3_9NEOB|nr:unnamed protein product [Ranitomeya imitator]